jgi:hypothetical protein
MADEGVASHYQVLEELGRKCFDLVYFVSPGLTSPTVVGGSFGVVYKAIERATGETVAIKLVSSLSLSLYVQLLICTLVSVDSALTCGGLRSRSTSNQAKMISRRFNRRSPF